MEDTNKPLSIPPKPEVAETAELDGGQEVPGPTPAALQGKTLDVTDLKSAHVSVPDIRVFGNGDTFELIAKASSEREGWMKSTKALEIRGVGVVLQVTTQQRNLDGGYAVAEALTFVPGVMINRADPNNKKLIGA